jgi:hypothetical protein
VSRRLEYRFAIPTETKPFEIAHHGFGGAGNHSWLVDVFDAQPYGITRFAGGKPCSEHGVNVADVHAS